MDYLEQLEYPLPVIKSNVREIYIETYSLYTGEILLRNTGGSTLSGYAASGISEIVFSPREFSGNRVAIQYTFSRGSHKQGDIIQTDIIITSNGGELIIPVTIKISPPALIVGDTELSSLVGFLDFAAEQPKEAEKLFVRPEFGAWLESSGFEHMELYEHFKFDPDKGRAVDNFLLLTGFKKKAVLSLQETSTTLPVEFGESGETHGAITVTRSERGFVSAEVFADPPRPWLRLLTATLNDSRFAGGHTAEIGFSILPELLPKQLTGGRAFTAICVKPAGGALLRHEIMVRIGPCVSARLSKLSYSFFDTGRVILENYSGADIIVELKASAGFIKFEGRKYLISTSAELPFDVKLTPYQLMQSPYKNDVAIHCDITVRTVIGRETFQKTLRLGVSDFETTQK